MSDVADRPSLYLVKSTNKSPRQSCQTPMEGSSIILEARDGHLAQNVVNVSDPRDATAIINGLVMALIQALRIQQNL